MFWKKIKSHEYTELSKRISEIESKVSALSADVAFYSDKVLKKIRPKRQEEEEEDEDDSGGEFRKNDIETIRKAFGGELPIEFTAENGKYKKSEYF